MIQLTLGLVVVRHVVVAVEGDTDFSLLLSFELVAIDLDGMSVREDQVVRDDVGLSRAVSSGA